MTLETKPYGSRPTFPTKDDAPKIELAGYENMVLVDQPESRADEADPELEDGRQQFVPHETFCRGGEEVHGGTGTEQPATAVGQRAADRGRDKRAVLQPRGVFPGARERNWGKGHFRRGKALLGMGRYKEAVDSLRLAIIFDTGGNEAKVALDNALLMI
ncbi:hypothetical protein AYI70_g3131 [Smittium culicis]|uniref:Translocation protein sec72 n=1 Tax=Smittium culicis TaxID=133412 RepID=A0A1R1Y5C8_9FUNG|nr:hypothetical protein AYI70_g3131 [Smittium culicis]